MQDSGRVQPVSAGERSNVTLLPGALCLVEKTHALHVSVARVRFGVPSCYPCDSRGGQFKSRSAACVAVICWTMMDLGG